MTSYRYAWANGWRWASWYLPRRLRAALRVLWSAYVRGYIGEACQECGRTYLLWHADDDLYGDVTGRWPYPDGEAASGLFCLDCFDRMAERRGIGLRWVPTQLVASGPGEGESR